HVLQPAAARPPPPRRDPPFLGAEPVAWGSAGAALWLHGLDSARLHSRAVAEAECAAAGRLGPPPREPRGARVPQVQGPAARLSRATSSGEESLHESPKHQRGSPVVARTANALLHSESYPER